MSTTRRSALFLSAVAILVIATRGNAQQQSQTTTTTTTTSPSSSSSVNTNTNSGPDLTGTSGHPDTSIKTNPIAGNLASAMANFSVRTGLEVAPDSQGQLSVRSVRPETPAARAGVEQGDVISSINGTDIGTFSAFQKLIARRPTEPAFFLTFHRGGQSFRIPLGRQLVLMGMTVFPDASDRPVVKEVEPSSPADHAGFKADDVITRVGHQQAIDSMQKLTEFAVPFIRNTSQGQGIEFHVMRAGKPIKLSVTRPSDADLPLLTPEQERHLRRLANGDDDRRAKDRPMTRKVTTTTRTSTGETSRQTRQMNRNNQLNGVAGVEGVDGNAGLANGVNGLAGGGFVGGFGGGGIDTTGLGTGTTGVGGTTGNVTAVAATLRGTPQNLNQNTLNPAQQAAANGGTQAGVNPQLLNAGVVGFVQVQGNVPFDNGAGTGIGTGVGGAPNPITGNRGNVAGVSPRTGNMSTNGTASSNTPAPSSVTNQPISPNNPIAPTTDPSQAQAAAQQNADQSRQQALQNQQAGVTGNNANGTNGSNITQSFVSARVSGIPAGTYTLGINQAGDCGNRAGAAPGPTALTLGTINVSGNGQGVLQTQINISPQVLVGRVVSLVPAGGVSSIGSIATSGQNQANTQSVAGNTNLVACGVFNAVNSGQSGMNNSGFVGGQGNGLNNGVNPGIFAGPGGTGVGVTGTGTTNPGTGTTGTGTTGTGTTAPPTNPHLPSQPSIPPTIPPANRPIIR